MESSSSAPSPLLRSDPADANPEAEGGQGLVSGPGQHVINMRRNEKATDGIRSGITTWRAVPNPLHENTCEETYTLLTRTIHETPSENGSESVWQGETAVSTAGVFTAIR